MTPAVRADPYLAAPVDRTTTSRGVDMPRQMSSREVTAFLMRGTRTAKVATTMNSGQPHVMPVWFVLDGDELVFTTEAGSVKARNLRQDPRIALVVDEDLAPYAFVHIRGRARMSEDMGEPLRFATEIGGRSEGQERAPDVAGLSTI